MGATGDISDAELLISVSSQGWGVAGKCNGSLKQQGTLGHTVRMADKDCEQ